MKKLLLLIILSVFTIGVNAKSSTGGSTTTDSIEQIKGHTDSIQAKFTVYQASDSASTDTTLSIKLSNGNYITLKFEKLPTPEKQWYEASWAIYLMMAMLIVALLLAIIANTGGTSEKEVFREVRQIVDERINTTPKISQLPQGDYVSRADFLKKINDLTDKLNDLEDILKKIQNERGPITPPAPRPKDVNPPKRTEIKLYASLRDANTLNISEAQTSRHTYVITLKSASDSEGTFEMINDKDIQQRCLNNTDMLSCCEKEGNGNNISRQIPGTVSVDRPNNTAHVNTKLKIFT